MAFTEEQLEKLAKKELYGYILFVYGIDIDIDQDYIKCTDEDMCQYCYYIKHLDIWCYVESINARAFYIKSSTEDDWNNQTDVTFDEVEFKVDSGKASDYDEETQFNAIECLGYKNIVEARDGLGETFNQMVIEYLFENDNLK